MSLVRINNSHYVVVRGVLGLARPALHVIDSGHVDAAGLTSRTSSTFGVILDGVTDSRIQAVIEGSASHGVSLVDTVDCVLQVNVDGAGSASVQLTTSDQNLITGSIIQAGTATTHAVNVVSGTANMIVGNNLGGTADYQTATIADTGTDTRWSYPGTATYGDNFTV